MAENGIGERVVRKEDQRFITGKGRYTDDFNFEGQAHIAFLRSPYAHGRIIGIDTAAAKTAPGVLGVFTGQDLEADGVGRVETDMNFNELDGTPMFKTQRLALPVDKVRFGGEPVSVP